MSVLLESSYLGWGVFQRGWVEKKSGPFGLVMTAVPGAHGLPPSARPEPSTLGRRQCPTSDFGGVQVVERFESGGEVPTERHTLLPGGRHSRDVRRYLAGGEHRVVGVAAEGGSDPAGCQSDCGTAKRRTLAGSLIWEALRDEQRVPEFPHSVIRRRRHTARRVGFF